MRCFLLIALLTISSLTRGQVTDSLLSKQKKAVQQYEQLKKADAEKYQMFQQNKESFKQKQEQRIEEIQMESVQIAISAAIADDPQEDNLSDPNMLRGPSQFDSRVEIRDLSPAVLWQQLILVNSRSVGMVVEKEHVHQVNDSTYQLDVAATLGDLFKLCPGEPFRDQPVIGTGTAFALQEKTMLTAGHVIAGKVSNYAVIFGFEMTNQVGDYEQFIPARDVYFPQQLVYRSEGLDVLAFSLDRSIAATPLTWEPSKDLQPGTPVYMIGHPMGLPQKAALNASMQGDHQPQFFYTTLDAFQGNSGSPVFDRETNRVIGILVSGELDYRWNGSCNASTLCRIPYCDGEKVIRIEEIMNEINQQ
jgi:S1-C subfamily serine protease